MRLSSFAIVIAFTFAAVPALGQGAVNVYNWSDYIAEDQLKVFASRPASRSTTRPTIPTRSSTPSSSAGRSGYDVVVPTASPFLVRQLAAKLYQPLDKAKLKNCGNLDPEIMAELAKYDPGNAHAIPWMWGTIGIGYNVPRSGSAWPTRRSIRCAMVFDPAIVSRFMDCGVMMLDSATDVFPAALKYLASIPIRRSPRSSEGRPRC